MSGQPIKEAYGRRPLLGQQVVEQMSEGLGGEVLLLPMGQAVEDDQ